MPPDVAVDLTAAGSVGTINQTGGTLLFSQNLDVTGLAGDYNATAGAATKKYLGRLP